MALYHCSDKIFLEALETPFVYNHKQLKVIIYQSKYFIPAFMFTVKYIGRLARMSVLDTEVDGSNPGISMLFP